MARNPLLGIDRPNPHPPGHDDLALGPSDSSDTGSDLAGLDAPDTADPDLPIDRALADDIDHPLGAPDARGNASDTAGTGERRSAAGDAGAPDGSDIGVDRVFSPFGEDADDDLPPADALALVDDRAASADGDEGEDENDEDGGEVMPGADAAADPPGSGDTSRARARAEAIADARTHARATRHAQEDESADPVGDGHSDADLAARLSHRPGQPNPEPDPPDDDAPVPQDDEGSAPGGRAREHREHQPGRDPAVRRRG